MKSNFQKKLRFYKKSHLVLFLLSLLIKSLHQAYESNEPQAHPITKPAYTPNSPNPVMV